MSKYEGHTPGDWEQETFVVFGPAPDGADKKHGRPILADFRPECDNPHPSPDECRANRRLFAAAPALLAERDTLRAENERLREALEEMVRLGEMPGSAYDQAGRMARAALSVQS